MSTKAGCILLDVKNEKVGLVYRRRHNDYSFPKGHKEDNESLEECAMRETEEEIGRLCCLLSSYKLPKLAYTDSGGNSTEAYYFLARDMGKSYKTFDADLVHEIAWKALEEVEFTLSYENLIDFWMKIKPLIKEIFEIEN